MIQEAAFEILQVATSDSWIQFDGVLAMHLHNAGTATATLDSGLTIAPGSTLVVATPLPNVVISSRHSVRFGSGTALLQVAALRMKGQPFSNYEHKRP